MKKLLILAFATALTLSGSVFAQDTMSNDSMKKDSSTTSSDSMGKLMKVKGKISDDGKSFTDDKESKTWTITNPDAVKGHEGHHVVLSAHVNADKSEVHVMSLKMAKMSKDSGMSKDNSKM